MQLDHDFYLQNDVVVLAKQLLGKLLFTRIDDVICSGIITETEAYAGISDKASHAFRYKRTSRTETMYQEGGCAYIYLIYGMYSLFNVVTNIAGVPHAILVRSIFPYSGQEIMQQRRNGKPISLKDGVGRGRLSRILGIDYKMSGMLLNKNQEGNAIWIEDHKTIIAQNEIQIGKRIGIEYAMEDAERPYRFWIDSKRLNLA